MHDPKFGKERFSLLKEMLKKHKDQNKATAGLEASKDPMGYMESHKDMSIKGLRGVAMYKGGLVRRK